MPRGVLAGVSTQQIGDEPFAFVDVTTNNTTGATSLALTYPTGTAEDDLLIAHIIHGTASDQTPNTPTGWTAFSHLVTGFSHDCTWWRRAPASPSGSVTFDGFDTSDNMAGFMAAWSGGSTSQTLTATRDNESSPNSVSHTIGTADSLAICWGGGDYGGQTTATATIGGSSATERLDTWFSASSDICLFLYDLEVASSGSTTYTINSTGPNVSTWATDWAP